MKSFFTCVAVAAAYTMFSVQCFAQSTVFSQPAFIPSSGDHGAFSSRTQTSPDPDSTMAFDDFVLPGTGIYDLTGISFAGIYDEAFPASPGNTDFEIQIWGHDVSSPDLAAGALYSYSLSAGQAGVSDGSVTTTALGHTSPTTPAVPGGGPAYGYEAALPGVTETLAGGTRYWISIQAQQTFPNANVNDPIWQWHLGSGSGSGFYAQDSVLDPSGTPGYGTLQFGKDLAFSLNAVPEPSTMPMLFAGVAALGLIRRRRS